MKILIVEDNQTFAEGLRLKLLDVAEGGPVIVAESRDSAIAEIEAQTFDLIIIDQKIPTRDKQMDLAETHGRAVFSEARVRARGTPIRFLTAFGMDDYIQDLLEEGERVDLWGSGSDELMVNKYYKQDLDLLISEVQEMQSQINELRKIEIVYDGHYGLENFHRRVLRIFGRQYNGDQIEVSDLGGGLSGIPVFGLTIRDSSHAPRMFAAAKIADLEVIKDEFIRYRQEIRRLNDGSYASLVGTVKHGAAKTGGNFYRLSENQQDLFSILKADEKRAVTIIGRMRECEEPWLEGRGTTQKKIHELRKRIAGDKPVEELIDFEALSVQLEGDVTSQSALEGLRKLDLSKFENRIVHVRWACQHGDLHGRNLLVKDGDLPQIIDYGDVGDGPACLDPVTLELSAIFHPDGVIKPSQLSDTNIDQWNSLEDCLAAHPLPRYTQKCREWAFDAGGGERALLATAYGYLLRQLRYPDTDKGLILRMLLSVVTALNQTFE